jgi:ADP-ribose pyrophosphatase
MASERTLQTELVYKGHVVNLRVDAVELPNGRKTKREIVEHGECVAIVAIDAQDNVILVRQFRKPVERCLLEVPAGGIDPGEEPEDCARRELEEETGYSAQNLEYLGGFYTSPGFCTEYMHLFLATGLEPGEIAPEADETIEVVPIPLAKITELITSGEICDAKSIAGLLRVVISHRPRMGE